MSRSSLAVALLCLTACSSRTQAVTPVEPAPAPTHRAPAQPAQPRSNIDPTQPSRPIAGDPSRADGRSEHLSPAEEKRRAEGIAAMDEGRFDEAKRIFEEILDRHPGNVATAALYEGAAIALATARRQATLDFANLEPTKVAAAPWRSTKIKDAPVQQASRPPKLVKVSEQKNQITDTKRWFEDHGLSMPAWEIPVPARNQEGNLPPEVPLFFGTFKIVEAIQDEGRAVLIYGPDFISGRVVLVIDRNGGVEGAFDFAAWSRSPKDLPADAQFTEQRVNWALVRDGVLFVATGHNTYARSSGGLNAFISAIDIETGRLLWRSDPLVANARNFVIHDGYIITGYGFTAEPDFMYVLDAKTGKTRSKLRVRSGPSHILEKAGRLHVRTYDTDYLFDLR